MKKCLASKKMHHITKKNPGRYFKYKVMLLGEAERLQMTDETQKLGHNDYLN